MANRATYTEDLEELYNQIRDGFAASETGSATSSVGDHLGNHRQPPPDNVEDSIYSLYSRGDDPHRSYQMPPANAAQQGARPLPRPPPQQFASDQYGSSSNPASSGHYANDMGYPSHQSGVKRLPVVPQHDSSQFAPSPTTVPSYFPNQFGEAPPPEKGRGAALYASALSSSQRPSYPANNSYTAPNINVQPINDGQRWSNGNGSASYGADPRFRTQSPNGSQNRYGPTSPGGYPEYNNRTPDNYYGDPRGLPGNNIRPDLVTHTSAHSANSFGQQYSTARPTAESPETARSPQLLFPGAQPYYGPGTDDYDAGGLGAALLRSTSVTSSASAAPSGSTYVPEHASVSDATSYQTDYNGYASGSKQPVRPGYQQHQTQYSQQSFNGSDYTTTPGYANQGFEGAENGRYSSGALQRDSFPPSDQAAEASRRRLDDERLQDRLTDLKQRLGKLEVDEPERLEEPEVDALDDEFYEDDEEEDDSRFLNLALLSHIAVRLRDKVPRATHVKGSIPYPRAFTGKEIVSTIQSIIQRELLITLGVSTNDRRAALQVARSLQNQLFFYEVEWGGRDLSDSVEDVFMFLDDEEPTPEDQAGSSTGGANGYGGGLSELQELPTGVITLLTKCYSPSCGEGNEGCYSYGCPRKGLSAPSLITAAAPEPTKSFKRGWKQTVSQTIIDSIGEREVRRQNIIFKMVEKEEQYIQDLDFIDTVFIRGLRKAIPPIIAYTELDSFIDDVFGNILDLRETNKRLLEVMYVRQREQKPVIQRIGDVFLTAAAEFRWAYPMYIGHLPVAEKRLKDEMEMNAEFRLFVEQCARNPDARRLDLKHFITRPHDHLKNYPILLEAALKETDPENPDVDFLTEAATAIRSLFVVAQLRTFQSAMGRGPTAKWQWHEIVGPDILKEIPKKEQKRQAVIFELIQTEMEYVKDLESIETLYIRPLRTANPPIIAPDRLNEFINDVFHNFADVHRHHKRMLERLHEIQRDEHPVIRSVIAPVYDAALNWTDAYMEYIPHYPIAAYRIDEEKNNNLAFKTFHDAALRQPDSRKLDMKSFIYRPIPRLLRYDLLLKAIKDASPAGHEDHDTVPQVLDVIKDLGKATESGVSTAKQKVELWGYNENLVFRPGEAVDMDLLDETRTLVFTGKLLRQPEGGLEFGGWSELFVLLFDNYLVMTKPKEKDGITKYHVNKRPIPLELLSLVGFTEIPQIRSMGLFGRSLRAGDKDKHENPAPAGADASGDSRTVYPCSIHHAGRLGGHWHLFAESAAARAEWKQKLEEAIALRYIVQESNKVFEIAHLSEDTFLVPSIIGAVTPSYSGDQPFTGKVTCSVPFSTADGRGLVAVGCAEGVWIGLRSDPKSLRRVLHLKMVTQCAMLEDFGIFLVLADKSLFAYHIEALVPSSPSSPQSARTPQKLNGTRDVQFFSVGTLNGRTLIIYMKRKGMDSVFRVLEPVIGKITEKSKNAGTFGRSIFGGSRSEWFRVYRDFFLPSESFDLIFLKAKIAILCTKGFEIMDLTDFKSVTIPQRDDPRLASLARRCDSCRPMGMFRSSENEFLLCYDEFGLYVDRHGDPNRVFGVIEWEGTAERVAFHPPYILIFDQRFIEIRHIEKGRLVQIIRGTDIRCLWDGRGASVPPIAPGPEGWQDGGSQESRVHAVMKSSSAQPNSKVVVQTVFELIPTVPLYLPPGPLQSPESSSYFPSQHISPPHSPQVMTMPQQWR